MQFGYGLVQTLCTVRARRAMRPHNVLSSPSHPSFHAKPFLVHKLLGTEFPLGSQSRWSFTVVLQGDLVAVSLAKFLQCVRTA